MSDIKLESINESDFNDIYEITSNINVMKFIGDSKIWDSSKTHTFIKYCVEEERLSDNKRQQYYYKILDTDNHKFVGVIGFHKFPRKELPKTRNEFYLSVYFNPNAQGNGYFMKSIKLLIEKMKIHHPRHNKLFMLVRQSNIKMNSISRAKFLQPSDKFQRKIKIGNDFLNQYYIDVNNFNNFNNFHLNQEKKSIKTLKGKAKTNLKVKTTMLGGYKHKKSNKKPYNRKTYARKTYKKNQISSNHIYLTAAKNVPPEGLDRVFSKRGNWEKYDPRIHKNRNIDFIYIDHQDNIYNKYIQSKKSYIKNFIDDDKHKVGRKNELYINLQKVLEKNPNSSLKNYLLEQYSFDWSLAHKEHKIAEYIETIKNIFEKTPGKVWIYKPVAGFAGRDIEIFENFEQFDNYIHNFIDKYAPVWDDPKNKSRQASQSNWVLQEYIDKPLLFEKKKFHIRPIFLYQKKGNKKIGYMLNKIFVAHAMENFKLEDFGNEHIHDTHFKWTSTGRIFFQDDFVERKILTKEEVAKIESQARDLATNVFNLMNSRCYSENKECYETFGMDIMIDQTLTIKLLEVQITNISYGFFDNDRVPGYSNIFEYILDNAMETVVDPIFPPKNKVPRIGAFVKFYEKQL